MNKKNFWFIFFLTIAIISILLLLTGAPLLTMTIDPANALPLGNLITWAGLISLPAAIYRGVDELRAPAHDFHKLLSVLLRIVILTAICWAPLAYLLSGNLTFSFSDKNTLQGGQTAFKWFWRLSYGIGIGALSIPVVYWLSKLFASKK